MSVTIYHNPKCGTSRKVLGMIREAGHEPAIFEYLKTPPSRETLAGLIERMGRPVREVLRRRGTPYEDLALDDARWSDEQLLDFMVQHPILIERPIVATDKGVRLCRPAETVMEILP